MQPTVTAPTLLVFTLGPESERARRQLLPASLARTEVRFHRAGLERVIAIGRRVGLRIVVAAPEPLALPADVVLLRQRGTSFAARLSGAVERLQSEIGNAPLLVVGTDTPDLDTRHLEAALARLNESPTAVVLGPSRDGGIYLCASRTPLAETLAGIRWCSAEARRALVTALSRCGRTTWLLEPLLDIDRRSDLERWLTVRTTPVTWTRLRGRLRRLLAAWRRPQVTLSSPTFDLALASALSRRGPPL